MGHVGRGARPALADWSAARTKSGGGHGALADFRQDLREQDAADEITVLMFTEFGRRMKDNGSGTDHGSGGEAFIRG